MRGLFKTFNVGRGDCITLMLQNGIREVHILVDCGCYTTEVDKFIGEVFHDTIDYLVISHIDNDHINGIISMLEKKPELHISHIFYNCYHRIPDNPQAWDDKMKDNIKKIMGNLPIIVDMLEYKVSEQKAVTLAELILKNDEWRDAWQREYITNESKPVTLNNGMGNLAFLSPTHESLDNIDYLYRKLFWQKLFKQKADNYDAEETIYEALIRSYENEARNSEEEKVSFSNLTEQALQYYASTLLGSTSLTNAASIAFEWECGEHRILFLGDSDPKTICESLSAIYSRPEKPVIFDAIKVSHHGSAENTSKELLSLADSNNYFFTGYTNVAPSISTISRIVLSPITDSINQRNLYSNRESDAILAIQNNIELKSSLHFNVQKNTEYEFSF